MISDEHLLLLEDLAHGSVCLSISPSFDQITTVLFFRNYKVLLLIYPLEHWFLLCERNSVNDSCKSLGGGEVLV